MVAPFFLKASSAVLFCSLVVAVHIQFDITEVPDITSNFETEYGSFALGICSIHFHVVEWPRQTNRMRCYLFCFLSRSTFLIRCAHSYHSLQEVFLSKQLNAKENPFAHWNPPLFLFSDPSRLLDLIEFFFFLILVPFLMLISRFVWYPPDSRFPDFPDF